MPKSLAFKARDPCICEKLSFNQQIRSNMQKTTLHAAAMALLMIGGASCATKTSVLGVRNKPHNDVQGVHYTDIANTSKSGLLSRKSRKSMHELKIEQDPEYRNSWNIGIFKGEISDQFDEINKTNGAKERGVALQKYYGDVIKEYADDTSLFEKEAGDNREKRIGLIEGAFCTKLKKLSREEKPYSRKPYRGYWNLSKFGCSRWAEVQKPLCVEGKEDKKLEKMSARVGEEETLFENFSMTKLEATLDTIDAVLSPHLLSSFMTPSRIFRDRKMASREKRLKLVELLIKRIVNNVSEADRHVCFTILNDKLKSSAGRRFIDESDRKAIKMMLLGKKGRGFGCFSSACPPEGYSEEDFRELINKCD